MKGAPPCSGPAVAKHTRGQPLKEVLFAPVAAAESSSAVVDHEPDRSDEDSAPEHIRGSALATGATGDP